MGAESSVRTPDCPLTETADCPLQAGEDMRGAGQVEGAAPDTVQSLQHEIEVIKAKIALEREKIRVSWLAWDGKVRGGPELTDEVFVVVRTRPCSRWLIWPASPPLIS